MLRWRFVVAGATAARQAEFSVGERKPKRGCVELLRLFHAAGSVNTLKSSACAKDMRGASNQYGR
jgi:hypothetical protein